MKFIVCIDYIADSDWNRVKSSLKPIRTIVCQKFEKRKRMGRVCEETKSDKPDIYKIRQVGTELPAEKLMDINWT